MPRRKLITDERIIPIGMLEFRVNQIEVPNRLNVARSVISRCVFDFIILSLLQSTTISENFTTLQNT